MITKKEARQTIKEYRKKLSDENVDFLSRIITDRIIGLDEYRKAEYVFLYKSINNEVITDYIADNARKSGKTTLYPKVVGEDMIFCRTESEKDFVLGFKDIPEPSDKCEAVEVENGIIIMPGLAFDRSFNRVGYGRGFYDRYLAKHSKLFKTGIAFYGQIFEEIEQDSNDIALDVIVTDTVIYRKKD